MPESASTAPPGWYPDQVQQLRYWDGARWTQHTSVVDTPAEKISVGGLVLALVVPFVGLIAGLISVVVGPQRKTGALMIAISVVSFVLYRIVLR